eukprot:PhM_4_TR5245/c0_g1_i3/m.54306
MFRTASRRFLTGMGLAVPVAATIGTVAFAQNIPTLMSMKDFYRIPQDYDDRGQIDFGEEPLVLHDNVFAQIGVIEEDALGELFTKLHPLKKDDVFCDLGSGVGNVCLFVYLNQLCRKAIGIEYIPSRHNFGVEALKRAQAEFPDLFKKNDGGVQLVHGNFVDCQDKLKDVTVYFTHSWTYDEPLLQHVADIVSTSPKTRLVFTSRKLPGVTERTKLKYRGELGVHADWHDEAPMHVYSL